MDDTFRTCRDTAHDLEQIRMNTVLVNHDAVHWTRHTRSYLYCVSKVVVLRKVIVKDPAMSFACVHERTVTSEHAANRAYCDKRMAHVLVTRNHARCQGSQRGADSRLGAHMNAH